MTKSLMDQVLEKAGGSRGLQQSLGVSKQTVSTWKRWGHVSATKAPAIERITGIPRQQLCPKFDWDGINADLSRADLKAA